MNPTLFLPSAILGYLSSVINVAYLMNVGQYYGTLGTSASKTSGARNDACVASEEQYLGPHRRRLLRTGLEAGSPRRGRSIHTS
jgi:hypothetical protein